MAVLRVKDDKGNVVPIPAIQGERGEKGEAGTGVHIGCYVGDGHAASRYIDLGSPNVKAVLLTASDLDVLLPTIVTAEGVTVNQNKVAWLVDAYANGTVDLGVAFEANAAGVTYHYLAFVEEVSA